MLPQARAAFCIKAAQSSEPVWETCEIRRDEKMGGMFSNSKLWYVAEAIGPKGKYEVARTPEFPGPDNKKDETYYDELIRKLTSDGWEYVGTYGGGGWQRRFRRRAR